MSNLSGVAGAAVPMAAAATFLRGLREALERGFDLPEAAVVAAGTLPRGPREAVARASRRLAGNYTEDEWGFDEEFNEAVYPFFELLYDRWWRVQASGVENVPSHGRALLTANHAGILPWDATMMSLATPSSGEVVCGGPIVVSAGAGWVTPVSAGGVSSSLPQAASTAAPSTAVPPRRRTWRRPGTPRTAARSAGLPSPRANRRSRVSRQGPTADRWAPSASARRRRISSRSTSSP